MKREQAFTLITYEDVQTLFKAVGLPGSRSHVTRTLRRHKRECPEYRISYKTVRFNVDDVHSLIQRLCRPWKEAA